MSSVFEFQSQHYEPKTDDLFLVYTAIDSSFNKNGWKVEDIDTNIKSGLGRPGILKPKDLNDPNDLNQEGNFVHPVYPNASLQALLQNQESYSIARAVRLDKPTPSSNWRVWLQVTDPKAKLALKNASIDNSHKYPRYVSPQVITFPADFPEEDATNTYKHWIISHWAFVDIPAYGEQMKVRGHCYGDLTDCKIKLQNASTAGFCVKDAMLRVLSSSHNSSQPTQSIMSESQTTSSPIQSNSQLVNSTPNTGPPVSYSWQPTTTTGSNTNPPITSIPSKQEAEPGSEQKPGMERGDTTSQHQPSPAKQEEDKNAQMSKDPVELQKIITTQTELIKDLQKRFTALEKDNTQRKQNEQRYYAASKVARYGSNFKSRDAFEKEVDTALRYSQVMSEQELEQYLADKFSKSVPVAKSAAVITTASSEQHEVPDVRIQANNASTISSDNNKKFLELMTMFENGGNL